MFATGAADIVMPDKSAGGQGMSDGKKALFFCTLLAFQFGLQVE